MPMDKPLLANEFIINSPPGTVIWEWADLADPQLIPVSLPSGRLSNCIPMFLVKLLPKEAYSLGVAVSILLKAGIYHYRQNNCAALYVLFRLGSMPHVHELWINHYSDERDSPLEAFTEISKLHFALHELSPTLERVISIPNSLNWHLLLDYVNNCAPWSMEA